MFTDFSEERVVFVGRVEDSALRLEAEYSPKMSENIYQITWCNIPEDRNRDVPI
jgi:hypothetical protein